MVSQDVKSHAAKARRKPWVAGLFSLLLPGLGQVYNGQMKKGLLLYCLMNLAALTAVLILIALPLAPVNVVGPVLILLVVYLYILIDAIRTARGLGDTYQPKAYNKWYVYLGIIVISGYLGSVTEPALTASIRVHLIQAFKIPAGSMEQALLIGDQILVHKYRYRSMPPQRFDIMVLQYPWEKRRDFIKRVIALPGEGVEVRNRQVYVNGKSLEEPHARYSPNLDSKNFGPVIIPKKGDTIEIRSDRRVYLNGQPIPIPSGRFYPQRRGEAMTGFEVFYGPLFPAETTLEKPTGTLRVQEDYYFTLGDTRDNSKDSRYWGFVPHSNLRGQAKTIYWSWDRARKRVRWKRIGQAIR